jgi:hypothetical protein
MAFVYGEEADVREPTERPAFRSVTVTSVRTRLGQDVLLHLGGQCVGERLGMLQLLPVGRRRRGIVHGGQSIPLASRAPETATVSS